MSIVEKALNKLRAAEAVVPAPIATETRIRATPTLPARAPSRDSAVVAPTSRDTAVSYRHQITIDVEALRARGMLPQKDDTSRARDELRHIKWPLLETALGRGGERTQLGNLIEITSSLPGEGKTYISLGLALSVALEHDCTVLLVDADVVKQHLTEAFGLQDRPGLVDLIADESTRVADLIVATDVEGLRILPAGRRNPGAPELIASKRTEAVFAALSAEFRDRVVLFDSAPLLATNEARLLSKLVGQVLVVVRASHTPQHVVTEALALLEGARSIACVLNQVSWRQSSEYYAGYYGYQSQQ